MSPIQAFPILKKGRIFRQKDGFSYQFDEFFFPVRASGIDEFRDMPMQVRPRRDDVSSHRPMVALAKGETVGGVVDGGGHGGEEIQDCKIQDAREEEEVRGGFLIADFGLPISDLRLPILDLEEWAGGWNGE